METVYIGLGSNLSQPLQQLNRAVSALQRLPRSKFGQVSKYYKTDPLGPPGQDPYLNAVVRLDTRLTPLELLYRLQKQELRQRRKRKRRWGPRTIDLDILLFGTRKIRHRDLVVPHYAMAVRDFVLQPLLDVAPKNLVVPDEGTLEELAHRCGLGQD